MTSSETGVDHSGDASTHAERLDPYESNRYENLMSGFGGFDSDPDQAEEGVDAIAMGMGGLRENPYDSNGRLKNNDQEDPDTSLAENRSA